MESTELAHQSVGMAGFEPAISCSRSRRIRPGFPTSRITDDRQSAQRESNPHVRHGKAVGCRYIMGTIQRVRIVKETESTGWDSNPRRRITGAVSSPLDDQCIPTCRQVEWDQRGSNPHPPG
jgi:hypothetical protein